MKYVCVLTDLPDGGRIRVPILFPDFLCHVFVRKGIPQECIKSGGKFLLHDHHVKVTGESLTLKVHHHLDDAILIKQFLEDENKLLTQFLKRR